MYHLLIDIIIYQIKQVVCLYNFSRHLLTVKNHPLFISQICWLLDQWGDICLVKESMDEENRNLWRVNMNYYFFAYFFSLCVKKHNFPFPREFLPSLSIVFINLSDIPVASLVTVVILISNLGCFFDWKTVPHNIQFL